MSTPKWKKAARQKQHCEEKARRQYEKLFADVKPIQERALKWNPTPPRQVTQHVRSVTSTGYAATPKQEPMVYTGNLIKGIATMHKSNAVPVISQEHAEDISKMRRN